MDASKGNRPPGGKRARVVLSIVAYLLCGVPVWWHTTSLQRPQLPHGEMARAGEAAALSQRTAVLPAHLEIYVVGGGAGGVVDAGALLDAAVGALGDELRASCVSVSVRVERPGGGCDAAPADSTVGGCLGLIDRRWSPGIGEDDDAATDAALADALGGGGGQAGRYVLFALPADGMDANTASTVVVAGQWRHAWLFYDGGDNAVPAAARLARAASALLARCYGAHARWRPGYDADADGGGGNLPLSAAGEAVLSFALLNAAADSSGGGDGDGVGSPPRSWDFERVAHALRPALDALAPAGALSLESRVLFYAPAAVNGTWSSAHGTHVLTPAQLPFFVDSEWALQAGRGSGSGGVAGSPSSTTCAAPVTTTTSDDDVSQLVEPHALHFVAYLPPPQQRPLRVLGADGAPAPGNGFWLPSWGGVVVLGDGDGDDKDGECGERQRGAVPLSDAAHDAVAAAAVWQLRELFGLGALPAGVDDGVSIQLRTLPAPRRGFALWEVDALVRRRVARDLAGAARVLGALSALVSELPNLEMPDVVGTHVARSLASLRAACDAVSRAGDGGGGGDYAAASAAARAARGAAEAAFTHPSVLTQLNFPESHKLGVYMPLFLPLAVPVLQGLVREAARYARRRRGVALSGVRT